MSRILMLMGIFLLGNGIFLSFASNFNLGVVLTILAGLFFALWGFYYKEISKYAQKGILRIIKYAIIVGLCAEVLLISFIAVYGQFDNVDYNEDAVVVLGAGIRGDQVTMPLKMRLDKAIEYHIKNPSAVIVVSGGQGFQETVTEASAMEKYLLQQGVDKSKIIKEENATSTNENMRFSKIILDELLGYDYKIAVITNNFHIYRGTTIAKNEGFENVSHMHAGLQWYNVALCYLRESLAVLKLWVIG